MQERVKNRSGGPKLLRFLSMFENLTGERLRGRGAQNLLRIGPVQLLDVRAGGALPDVWRSNVKASDLFLKLIIRSGRN